VRTEKIEELLLVTGSHCQSRCTASATVSIWKADRLDIPG
jgi:hypothetical protein